MTFKAFDLKPHNGQKSFGNKATVLQEDNISRLKSYDTIVAEYNHTTNQVTINGYYSQTTARHINSFLIFYGFDKMTKSEMIAASKK